MVAEWESNWWLSGVEATISAALFFVNLYPMLMCRTLVFVAFALFVILNGKAQNLVPNPSFENFTSCPGGGAFYKVSPWCGLGGGEDSYNTCNNIFGPGGVSIPYAFQGFQYPRTGNGFGSFVLFTLPGAGQNRREYLHVPLTEPLKAGKIYCGTMYLNLYNECKNATDKAGMYFSTTPFACNQAMPTPQTIAPLNVVPQIINPGNFITDTLNWTEFSGTFVAAGNEQYLTIGNFLNDAMTTTITVNPATPYLVLFFNIDDVSLEEIIPARSIKDSTICMNDSITLAPASPTEFAEYTWQPANGLSCTNCASPKASPQSTTTYTLTKRQCKATTSAHVTISVKTDCDVKATFEIPNVFTPNEDRINDTFRVQLPVGSVLKEFNIYNRWGNLVHSTEPHGQTVLLWDGHTTAGEACSAGVYYYVLQYQDADGGAQKHNGFISLIK